MEHWSPDKSRTTDDPPVPRDVWMRWLLRAPAHEVLPDSPRMGDWAGGAMILGVVAFWAAMALLLWRALG